MKSKKVFTTLSGVLASVSATLCVAQVGPVQNVRHGGFDSNSPEHAEDVRGAELERKARALWDSGDIDSAARVYETAVEARRQGNNNYGAMLAQQESYIMQGRFKEAAETARFSERNYGHGSLLWLLIADCETGNLDEAKFAMSNVSKSSISKFDLARLPISRSDDIKSLEATGWAIYAMAHQDEHSELANAKFWLKANDLSPNNFMICYTRSKLLLELKQTKLAMPLLLQAEKSFPRQNASAVERHQLSEVQAKIAVLKGS